MKTEVTAYPNEKRGTGYFFNIGMALSQLLASFLNLNCDLTFSAYCGYWKQQGFPILGKFHKLIDLLFSDPNHCEQSWLNKS